MQNDSNITLVDEKMRERLIPEFEKVIDTWGDLRLRTIYRYHDLNVGNSEREFNLSLALVSISVAFLTIIVPLLQDYLSLLFSIALICFLIASILGLIDLFWTIYRDRVFLKIDSKWEDDKYKLFQSTAIKITEKLKTDKPVLRKEVEEYFSLKSQMSNENEERVEERKDNFWTKSLQFLHWTFIGCFFLGFILLMIVIFLKLNPIT